MKPFLLSIVTLFLFLSADTNVTRPIGWVDLSDGAWCQRYTNGPGYWKGPRTNCFIMTGVVPVWGTNGDTNGSWLSVSSNGDIWVYNNPAWSNRIGWRVFNWPYMR